MADIKYIIEALRQKPTPPGIYREKGLAPRRQRGGLMETLKTSNNDTNYKRYVSTQQAIGETPVSYEEWSK